MKIPALALLLTLTSCVASSSVERNAVSSPTNPSASAQFEALKGMEGSWMFSDATTGETAQIDYRVTGGGSAVVETFFPGTEMEMVSVYTLDQGDLRMTHYCLMGNQPNMVALPCGDASRIEFVCQGGGNLASCDDAHMHAGAFHFKDTDHVDAKWSSYAGGAVAHETTFHLERR